MKKPSMSQSSATGVATGAESKDSKSQRLGHMFMMPS